MRFLRTYIVVLLLAFTAPPGAAQSWREAAEARIEAHRKGDLTVVVQDASGRLAPGAQVQATLRNHAFRFGTAINAAVVADGPAVDLVSNDLDLGEKPCGVRFRLDVPRGAEVSSAYIQFTADKNNQSDATSLNLAIHETDDAPDFSVEDVTSRTLSAPVAWSPPAWTTEGEQATPQRTPDLAALVQAVVNRSGWTAGNHVAFALTGSGKRSARALDVYPNEAAVLHVTYTGGTVESMIASGADDAEEVIGQSEAERYRQETIRLFNYVTLENALKWDQWEADRERALRGVAWAEANGLAVRGHTLIWSRWPSIPADVSIRQSDPDYVRRRAREHVTEEVDALQGRILEWDVVNEPLHEQALEPIVGYDERVVWYQLAKAADPGARLFVNDFDILEGPAEHEPYKTLVRDLIAAGAPIEGIGAQGHFLGARPSPEQLWQRLESLAELGLPVQITEFDMNSGWSAQEQAAHLEATLTLAFSHPSVTAFIMWGFWDRLHWLGNAPLYQTDWTLKPAGKVFMDLVHGAWKTEETLTTDAQGEASLRGFLGEYQIVVTHEGSATETEYVLEPEGGTLVVTLPTQTGLDPPDMPDGTLSLEGPWPNPASGRVLFRVSAPAGASGVSLVLFDVLGREVFRMKPGSVAPGNEASLAVDVSGLSPGLYLYRLNDGGVFAQGAVTGRLMVVR